IACPCALALAAPFAYGTLQRLFGQQGYYLRGPGVIQELGRVNAFVFDKTGTLVDNENEETVDYHTDEHTAASYAPVFLAMAEQSDHPRSRAMARALRSTGVQPITVHGLSEEIGKGLVVHHHGQDFRLGKPIFCGLPATVSGTYAVVGNTPVFSLKPASPHLRPGGKRFLHELSKKGSTALISGDQQPKTGFWKLLFQPERTHFDMSPFAKQAYVEQLQSDGREVLMVGDGLNDAGALRTANVGLAVSDDEARFSPACDGILTGDELHLLPRVLQAAGNLKWVLWLTFGIAFCYNIIGLSYAVSGTLSPIIAAILMPLSSITVVLVATIGSWLVYSHSFRHTAQ
ncbi:MAG: HAD-IC family P-type ATPase, partial [Lewinella sp.]